jgi:hypothetical protein
MRMNPLLAAIVFVGSFTVTGAVAKPPAEATGECKDGSYTKAEKKEGACSSHGGVKDWFVKAAVERPADATGQCKDGTYSNAASKSGACSGHQGVKDWYGADAKTASKAAPEAKPSPAAKKTAEEWQRPATAAAGGGAGKVWVNSSSKVFHCEKDQWYGKTKHGEYMTQAQAKTSGARPAYGKECG